MKKTVCSMLGTFVLVCLLVIFPVRVWAAEVTDSEKGITYELTQQTDGSYSVTVTVNQDQTELVIPSSVVGEDGTVYSIQRVEEISWKPEEMNIQKLTFADGIKTIVRSAMSDFVSTENLTVQFPDTLEDVEDGFVIRCDANLTERIVPKWLQDMTPEDGVVRLSGMEISVKAVQSQNALQSRSVICAFSANSTLARLLHPPNAPPPICPTESGI